MPGGEGHYSDCDTITPPTRQRCLEQLLTTPPRVLVVTGLHHRAQGGVQRATVRLVEGIADAGVPLAMLADGPIIGIEAHHGFALSLNRQADWAGQISSAVSSFQPDLVHVVSAGVRLLQVVESAVTDHPWLLTVHNVPPFEQHSPWLSGHNTWHYWLRDLRSAPSAWLWGRFFRRHRYSGLITHSDLVRSHVHRWYPGAPVSMIPLAADPPGSADPTDSPFADDVHPRLLSVGGFSHNKGFHDYLQAVARLKKPFPRLQYCIIGDMRRPHYAAFIRQQIKSLGLEDSVLLRAHAPDSERLAATRAADLYIQPSHEEGFCIAFLEAALMGGRLLGTDTGAIAMMAADDPLMRVVPPMDISALTEASQAMLATPVTEAALSARLERLGPLRDWRHYTQAHLDCYRDTLDRRSR